MRIHNSPEKAATTTQHLVQHSVQKHFNHIEYFTQFNSAEQKTLTHIFM